MPHVLGPFSLQQPLAGAFLAFCLLPSLTLHASQAIARVPEAVLAQAASLPTLHRHWSAELIRVEQLQPVLDLADQALPLAMLPGERLEHLVLMAGATLAGQTLRHCIVRDEVQAVQAQLGDALLSFVQQRAQELHPGLAVDFSFRSEGLVSELNAMGSGLLAAALLEASPGVGRRGLLRLPISAPQQGEHLSITSSEALRLSLALLQELDPQWLSLFPATP